MKSIFIICSLILFAFAVSAQDGSTFAKSKVLNESTVFNKGGSSVTDTASKSQTKYFYVMANPFVENIKIRSTVTKKTGYAKARTIIQTSLDGNTWVAKDTIALASTTTATGLSDLINCKDRFTRILLTPYDSTQVIYYKYTILIEKGQ